MKAVRLFWRLKYAAFVRIYVSMADGFGCCLNEGVKIMRDEIGLVIERGIYCVWHQAKAFGIYDL